MRLLQSSASTPALTLDVSDLDDAVRAIDVMALIKSVPLANLLCETVFCVSAQFEGDVQVQTTCEKIMLKLMAVDLISIKR